MCTWAGGKGRHKRRGTSARETIGRPSLCVVDRPMAFPATILRGRHVAVASMEVAVKATETADATSTVPFATKLFTIASPADEVARCVALPAGALLLDAGLLLALASALPSVALHMTLQKKAFGPECVWATLTSLHLDGYG